MNRRNGIVAAGVALLVGGGLAFAQKDDVGKVDVTATKVAGNVWIVTGQGGNIAVSAGPDGQLLVDDQFAPLAPKIEAAIKKTGKGPLRWVVNTHHHFDHTGGNAIFGKKAPIVAHANVRRSLEKGTTVAMFNAKIPPAEAAALPVVTYDQQVSLWLNGEEVRVEHYPHGHTDGDSVVWFTGSKVVHTGDDFVNGSFPFLDVDAGGDVESLAKNVADIESKLGDGWKVIPGHGSVGDKAAVSAFREMLEVSIKTVKDGIAAGKTREQIQLAGLPAEYDSWGKGFIDSKTWLMLVHESITNKAR